jgi:hypothetical protein
MSQLFSSQDGTLLTTTELQDSAVGAWALSQPNSYVSVQQHVVRLLVACSVHCADLEGHWRRRWNTSEEERRPRVPDLRRGNS